MTEPFNLRDMTPDELRSHTARTELHARSLADRMIFLESVMARALHEHSVPDRVCVCKRCLILRAALRQPAGRESRERTRNGDVEMPDDIVHE